MDKQDLRTIPKRKISEAEKQIIMLKIERVRLEREKSMMILNKAVMLFFAFLVVAVVGLINSIVTPVQLNILVMVGVSALIIGVIPYSISIRKEEKDIEETLKELTE
jgi:hypothetical protein